jgi:hypothetical protein
VFIAIVYHPVYTLQGLFKNRFFLTKILRSGIYQTYEKTSRKILEVLMEVMQAQVHYTLCINKDHTFKIAIKKFPISGELFYFA